MPRLRRLNEWLRRLWERTQPHVPAVGLVVLIVFAVVGTISNLIQIRREIIQPPPIRYLAEPKRVDTPLCPDDTFLYSFRFEIDEEVLPVALTIDRGIWSLDMNRFVVGSKEAITYPYNRPAIISRTSAYRIPLTMDDGKVFPAGNYALMVTGESELRETVGFEIPFVMKSPEECK